MRTESEFPGGYAIIGAFDPDPDSDPDPDDTHSHRPDGMKAIQIEIAIEIDLHLPLASQKYCLPGRRDPPQSFPPLHAWLCLAEA